MLENHVIGHWSLAKTATKTIDVLTQPKRDSSFHTIIDTAQALQECIVRMQMNWFKAYTSI